MSLAEQRLLSFFSPSALLEKSDKTEELSRGRRKYRCQHLVDTASHRWCPQRRLCFLPPVEMGHGLLPLPSEGTAKQRGTEHFQGLDCFLKTRVALPLLLTSSTLMAHAVLWGK